MKLAQKIKLTLHQQEAFNKLKAFCSHDNQPYACVLLGYAGTGKTTLVSQLIEMLSSTCEIAVAAPTNKAVSVLQLKVHSNCKFGSIHSFLGLKMKEKPNGSQICESFGKPKLSGFDLLIVDEASMISNVLFKKIMDAVILENIQVLFVGDPAQLPPVDPELIESQQSPVFTQIENQITLTEIVRQAEDSPVIRLSMMIRDRVMCESPISIAQVKEALIDDPRAMVLSCQTTDVVRWAVEEAQEGRDCRILAFTNRQVERYCREVHERLYGLDKLDYCPGEKIIFQSQYTSAFAKGCSEPVVLHNSLEAVVVSVIEKTHPNYPEIAALFLTIKTDEKDDPIGIWVPKNMRTFRELLGDKWRNWQIIKDQTKQAKKDGDFQVAHALEQQGRELSSETWAITNSFASIRHCYAMTVHKSQGSTLDTALVDFNDIQRMPSVADRLRALYVAVTRPSHYLAVFAA